MPARAEHQSGKGLTEVMGLFYMCEGGLRAGRLHPGSSWSKHQYLMLAEMPCSIQPTTQQTLQEQKGLPWVACPTCQPCEVKGGEVHLPAFSSHLAGRREVIYSDIVTREASTKPVTTYVFILSFVFFLERTTSLQKPRLCFRQRPNLPLNPRETAPTAAARGLNGCHTAICKYWSEANTNSREYVDLLLSSVTETRERLSWLNTVGRGGRSGHVWLRES